MHSAVGSDVALNGMYMLTRLDVCSPPHAHRQTPLGSAKLRLQQWSLIPTIAALEHLVLPLQVGQQLLVCYKRRQVHEMVRGTPAQLSDARMCLFWLV